jgi:hypothetical protein
LSTAFNISGEIRKFLCKIYKVLGKLFILKNIATIVISVSGAVDQNTEAKVEVRNSILLLVRLFFVNLFFQRDA